MIAAQDVELALIEGLEAVALQCQERPRRYEDWHIVKDFDATNASACEASCAAHVFNNDGFSPDVFKSFKTLARDSIHSDGSPRDAVVASLMALRRDAERPRGLDWLCRYIWHEIDEPQRARLASMSISWLARLSSALGHPDMSHWKGGERVQWQYPERGLRLEATIDAVTDQGDLVIVGPATDEADAKAAYSAVIFVASRRRVPEVVLLVDPSRRTARTFEISELLSTGLRTAESAARAVITASSRELAGLTKTPSYFICRDCPGLDQCGEGKDLLNQPVTVRGGMRIQWTSRKLLAT
ncbi:MAG: hypothetical protein OXG34_02785 [bacterium]|nr:hypothetical protein [bacterium]